MEILLLIISKVFEIKPFEALNYLFDNCSSLNKLWIQGEENYKFKRLLKLLDQIKEKIPLIAKVICKNNYDLFCLFMNFLSDAPLTPNINVSEVYMNIMVLLA